MGKRACRILGAYLIGEAAIHDSLSLIGGVVSVLHGVWFGYILIGWAVVELLMKGLAGTTLYTSGGLPRRKVEPGDTQ